MNPISNSSIVSINNAPERFADLRTAVENAWAMLGPERTPNGPRAVLVSIGHGGQIKLQPVESGQSIVRLDTELIDHLNSKPLSDEFIIELRDYCEGRLAVRAEAERTGGFVIPRAPGRWEIAHVNAFQPLTKVQPGGSAQ